MKQYLSAAKTWRIIAKAFEENDSRLALRGLCFAIRDFYWNNRISDTVYSRMTADIYLFQPESLPVYFWPMDHTEESNLARATAAGFLAAMSER